MQEVWAERADAAEGAIVSRHLRRLCGMPRTALGVVALALLFDASGCSSRGTTGGKRTCSILRSTHSNVTRPPKRRRRVAKVARSVRVRNVSAWTNNYYDDMAWLGLSLERAQRMFSVDHRTAVQALESQLFDSWSPADGGGIPWCKGSDFYNTPANGPAGIMLARTGKTLACAGNGRLDRRDAAGSGLRTDLRRYPPRRHPRGARSTRTVKASRWGWKPSCRRDWANRATASEYTNSSTPCTTE